MKLDSRAPLIVAIVLLLLPLLYVGSYSALVEPGYRIPGQFNNYRMGGPRAEAFFWPLEQIDRKLRPGAWDPQVRWKSAGGGTGPVRTNSP